jgi:hypothetical protein
VAAVLSLSWNIIYTYKEIADVAYRVTYLIGISIQPGLTLLEVSLGLSGNNLWINMD